jgi:hypothetical protein
VILSDRKLAARNGNPAVIRAFVSPILAALTVSLLFCAPHASAHPMLENGIDVVIGPDRIVIDARIATEELLLVETPGQKPPPPEQWAALATRHAAYVRDHLQLVVDGQSVNAASWNVVNPVPAQVRNDPTHFGQPVAYHLEYALSKPPVVVTLRQNFLREYNSWSASCVLRERQSTEPEFELGLLASLNDAEFDCTWPTGPASPPATAPAPTSRSARPSANTSSTASGTS